MFVLLRVRALTWRYLLRLMQYEVTIWPLCAILLSNGCNGSTLISVFCWMHETGVVLAWNQQQVCFYCCCVCLNLKVLVVSVRYTMRVMPPSCMRYFAFQMHYNGDDGSSLIFVCWTGGVLTLNEQAVSLFCCVHLKLNASLVFNQVWGHSFTLIMWYPNILQWRWRLCVDLCSLDAWNGWHIGRWPWTDSAYVCITACTPGLFS